MLTPAWTQLRPHPIQSACYYCPKRFVRIHAGRRSGKTELAKRRLVSYLPVDTGRGVLTNRYAYLGPTRQQAKRIAWQHLKDLTPKAWVKSYDNTNLIINTVFNSELHVIGMDNPARFEGDEWMGVVSDESSDQKPELHLSVRPALTPDVGWWWQIGIAKRQGCGAAKYREACEEGYRGNADPNSEYATFTWPSWDIIPASEIEQLQHDLDEKDYLEQVGGAWQAIGGAAFHAFDSNRHVAPLANLPDATKPILVGSDFNVSPMAWVLGQSDGKELHIFDEVWLKDTNTLRTLDILWDRYGASHKGGWIFYGDATGQSRKTSASDTDYAHIMNDKRFNAKVIYPRSNPPIKDRLASCNAILCNAAKEVRCHIDPRCLHLISDLENRGLTSDGFPSEAKSGMLGHISDAWGYLIHSRWPIRVESRGTGTFGVYSG